MGNPVYQDEMDPQELGFPRQKSDPRGLNPVVIAATPDNWKVPFPLTDGSDGEAQDKVPTLHDDSDPDDADPNDADFEAERVYDGSSHFPPWLQRFPNELDGPLAGCNPHAARKGRPTRRLRRDTHNGQMQRLPPATLMMTPAPNPNWTIRHLQITRAISKCSEMPRP